MATVALEWTEDDEVGEAEDKYNCFAPKHYFKMESRLSLHSGGSTNHLTFTIKILNKKYPWNPFEVSTKVTLNITFQLSLPKIQSNSVVTFESLK